MKNKIKAILLGSLFLLSGCALESEIYDKINPSIYPKTESDIKALVTGSVYSIFSSGDYANLFCVPNGVITASEVVSDIMTCTWGNHWVTLEYNSYEIDNALVGNNLNQWKYYYRLGGMILTEDRIQNADIRMADGMKERYVAETKCGMGFMAFLLYDLYGPIVLPDLELLKNPVKDLILPRATEEEMRTFIEGNLLEAARILPYKYSDGDYGRFTKGLAKTLLLKYYMRVGDWDNAVKVGKDLVENPEYGYQIEDDYYKLFSPEGKKNPEVIFASTSATGALQNLYQVHVYPGEFPYKDEFPGSGDNVTLWGGYRMAWSFYNSYDKNDYRLKRIYGEFTDVKGIHHSELEDKTNGGTLAVGAIPGKYSIVGQVGDKSPCDLVIYRFSDVKTLYAEALVRLENKVSQTAKDLLNEIRTKHGRLPAFTNEELNTPEKFLDKMLMERGHEFYMEGVRRQDLLRHGKFIEKAIEKAKYAGHSIEKISTMVDGKYKYELLPIPQNIITEGQGKIKQNPGY